jgi:subtilisin family serine protease
VPYRGLGGRSVHALVKELRAAVEPHALVAPHHVASGSPKWAGGPAVPARTSPQSHRFPGAASGRVRVAVIDTGYTDGLHADLDGHIASLPAAPEDLDHLPQNGWLDDEAGHGTFIAGIVATLAPEADIVIGDVLESDGYGFELTIADEIIRWARKGVDILNLSLGAYSESDRIPLAIAEALRHLPAGSVLVAAAGNDCTSRPFWPAAAKRVIGVGAIDQNDPPGPAPFTNFGSWVDCCAPGVDVDSAFMQYDETARTLNPAALPGRPAQDFAAWATWSGTSFSAPYVSGKLAELMLTGAAATAHEAAVMLLGPGQQQLPGLGIVVR